MAEQTERAFQKQPTVFLNNKLRTLGIGKKAKKDIRYVRNVGLGFKTPREARCNALSLVQLQAVIGTYIDKNVHSPGTFRFADMQRTIVIRRDYLHFIKKYRRYEKRHRNMSVHCSPAFRDIAVGDIVTVGECRPLSKTVRYNVLKVLKASGAKKSFDKKWKNYRQADVYLDLGGRSNYKDVKV
ncbi:40S ribosomal protein S11 [Dirofilaria immitis]|nr:40S ribosomal protein S11 [Dirofilaria immitis]